MDFINSTIQILISLLPCAFLLITGYSWLLILGKKLGAFSLVEKFFIVLILGTAEIIFPVVCWVFMFDYSLASFYVALSIIILFFSLVIIFFKLRELKKDINYVAKLLLYLLKGNWIEKFVLISVIFFIFRTIIYLLIVPINVDALYFYLPSALSFIKFGHVYPYADPPAAPLLFSWSYTITGNAISEPFREIPLLFVLSAPLLVYAFSKRYLNRQYCLVAMIFCLFSPLVETATYLWPWHTDLIAAAFAGMAIYFILRRTKYSDIVSGISFSLCLLTKTPFGLATAVILLSILLLYSNKKLQSIIFFAILSVVFLIFGFVYSFSQIAIMSPQLLAILFSSILISILIACFIRSKPNAIRNENFPFRLWVFLIFAIIPVAVWTYRQVLLGGSPFALPIFQNTSPDVSWWSTFTASTYHLAPSSLNVGLFFLLFYHPLLGLSLIPLMLVGFFYAFKNKQFVILPLLTLLYFFIWLSSFSTGTGYRHLYPTIFFLFPIIAIGFAKISDRLGQKNSVYFLAFLILFLGLESTQDITFQISSSRIISGSISWFSKAFTPAPSWLDYKSIFQTPAIVPLLVSSCIIAFLFPIVVKRKQILISFRSKTHSLKFRNTLYVALLFLFTLSVMILPIFDNYLSTESDLSSYSTNSSWYSGDIQIANDLPQHIKDGGLLTFGFNAFYYLAKDNISYFDLLYGSITSFPLRGPTDYHYLDQAIQATNLSSIKSALFDHFGIHYLLLPTSGNSIYEKYLSFNNNSNLFMILLQSNSARLIKEYNGFRLFSLYFNDIILSKSLIFSSNFNNSSDGFNPVAGKWAIINSTYCGINNQDFAFSVLNKSLSNNFEASVEIESSHLSDTGLVFNFNNSQNFNMMYLNGHSVVVMKMQNGSPTYPWSYTFSSGSKTWYNLTLISIEKEWQILVNNHLIFDLAKDGSSTGYIGLGLYGTTSYYSNFSLFELQVGSL